MLVFTNWVNAPYVFLSSNGIDFERIISNDDGVIAKSNNISEYAVEKSAIFYGVSGYENKVILAYNFSNSAIK